MTESYDDKAEVAEFKKISIPLMKRIYPSLMNSKLSSVQPFPTSFNYYLNRFEVVDEAFVKPKEKPQVWHSIDDPWEPQL